MSEPSLAPQVCITCKTRKKGCDKKLPACGYCTKRTLTCRYDQPDPHERTPYADMPVSMIATNQEMMHGQCSSVRSCLLLTTPLSNFLQPSYMPMTVDGMVELQVCQIIQATGQTAEDVIIRYSQGNHTWLPFIALNRFRRRRTAQLSAEVSVLLLSICLITYDPSCTSAGLVDQKSLYLATKMLFAQVQACVPSSTCLTQAALLISVYEFACGRAKSAYLSIGNCARMAYAIGIHNLKPDFHRLEDHEALLKADEERNLWWGIVICERIFFCEEMSSDQPLASGFSSTNELLPSENELPDQINKQILSSPLTPVLPGGVGGFGRQAQAAYLLNKLLSAIKIIDTGELRIALSKLDSDLQSFLLILIEQCDGTWGLFCGAIVITIRALFVLHWHVLKQAPVSKTLEEWQESSWAALDTVTKVMVDIAHSDSKNITHANIDMLPPTCWYTLQASLEHLEASGRRYKRTMSRDCEAISNMAGHFKHRWNIDLR